MKEKLIKGAYVGKQHIDSMEDVDIRKRAITITTWLTQTTSNNISLRSEQLLQGHVVRLAVGQFYGFIKAEDGKEWFFHRNDLQNETDWYNVRINDEVRFSIGSNASGPCAVDVVLSE